MKTCLANPITSTANRISSLFDGAEGVHTKLFFHASKLKIYYDNKDMATALASVMKTHFKLGNLHLDVEILYKAGAKKYVKVEDVAPAKGSKVIADAITVAFCGCPSFEGIVKARDPNGILWYFALGSKIGCQYKNDDIQNPWSMTTELPESIFKFCLRHKGVQISSSYEKPSKAKK